VAAAPAAAQYSEERRKENDPTHHSFSIGFLAPVEVITDILAGVLRAGLVQDWGQSY
jgi:hypothetical protein